MSDKKELPYYIVGLGLLAIAIVVDFSLGNSTTADPSWMAAFFKGSLLDWVGIVLFNLGLIGMALGMFGVWEVYSNNAKTLGRVWLIALAASLALIYL